MISLSSSGCQDLWGKKKKKDEDKRKTSQTLSQHPALPLVSTPLDFRFHTRQIRANVVLFGPRRGHVPTQAQSGAVVAGGGGWGSGGWRLSGAPSQRTGAFSLWLTGPGAGPGVRERLHTPPDEELLWLIYCLRLKVSAEKPLDL